MTTSMRNKAEITAGSGKFSCPRPATPEKLERKTNNNIAAKLSTTRGIQRRQGPDPSASPQPDQSASSPRANASQLPTQPDYSKYSLLDCREEPDLRERLQCQAEKLAPNAPYYRKKLQVGVMTKTTDDPKLPPGFTALQSASEKYALYYPSTGPTSTANATVGQCGLAYPEALGSLKGFQENIGDMYPNVKTWESLRRYETYMTAHEVAGHCSRFYPPVFTAGIGSYGSDGKYFPHNNKDMLRYSESGSDTMSAVVLKCEAAKEMQRGNKAGAQELLDTIQEARDTRKLQIDSNKITPEYNSTESVDKIIAMPLEKFANMNTDQMANLASQTITDVMIKEETVRQASARKRTGRHKKQK